MNRGYTLIWRKVWANPLFCEPGRKFTRLEAWLHLTNVLATGIDDPDAGLARGEFRVSVRRLARLWSWSPSATFRFMRQLEENRMISRVKHSEERPAA